MEPYVFSSRKATRKFSMCGRLLTDSSAPNLDETSFDLFDSRKCHPIGNKGKPQFNIRFCAHSPQRTTETDTWHTVDEASRTTGEPGNSRERKGGATTGGQRKEHTLATRTVYTHASGCMPPDSQARSDTTRTAMCHPLRPIPPLRGYTQQSEKTQPVAHGPKQVRGPT
jgi:hypothetical protein